MGVNSQPTAARPQKSHRSPLQSAGWFLNNTERRAVSLRQLSFLYIIDNKGIILL